MSASFDAFVSSLVDSVQPLESLEIPLLEAMGCSVASDVVSAVDVPAVAVPAPVAAFSLQATAAAHTHNRVQRDKFMAAPAQTGGAQHTAVVGEPLAQIF